MWAMVRSSSSTSDLVAFIVTLNSPILKVCFCEISIEKFAKTTFLHLFRTCFVNRCFLICVYSSCRAKTPTSGLFCSIFWVSQITWREPDGKGFVRKYLKNGFPACFLLLCCVCGGSQLNWAARSVGVFMHKKLESKTRCFGPLFSCPQLLPFFG